MLTRLTDEKSTVVVTLSPARLPPSLVGGGTRAKCGGLLGIAGDGGARHRKRP